MTLIIGCGDGDLVELKNNGNDQAMFDLGNQEIRKNIQIISFMILLL